MSDYPYPNLNQTPYSQSNNQGYNQNQNYPQNQPNNQFTNYHQNPTYSPNQPIYAAGYNDPNHPDYEIYNGRYSGRQRWIIMGLVFLFTCIVVGAILLITRSMKSQQRYPNYY